MLFLFLFLDFSVGYLFSLSGTVSPLIEVKFLSDLMTSSEVCLAWFSLFLFVTAASFLFPSGISLLVHYKSFPSLFVFLLHFHTFLLVLLFLLPFSDTETAKYFKLLMLVLHAYVLLFYWVFF